MARRAQAISFVLFTTAILAGCSGSAKVTVENKLDEPVHVIVHPCGGVFVATQGLEEAINPAEAMSGWLRVRLSPPFVSIMDVECAGVQLSTGASGRWWIGSLVGQAEYELRVVPGTDGPAVEQRLNSRGLHGWRTVALEHLDSPWRADQDRRIPAKPSGPLPD